MSRVERRSAAEGRKQRNSAGAIVSARADYPASCLRRDLRRFTRLPSR